MSIGVAKLVSFESQHIITEEKTIVWSLLPCGAETWTLNEFNDNWRYEQMKEMAQCRENRCHPNTWGRHKRYWIWESGTTKGDIVEIKQEPYLIAWNPWSTCLDGEYDRCCLPFGDAFWANAYGYGKCLQLLFPGKTLKSFFSDVYKFMTTFLQHTDATFCTFSHL